jgi:hypothetical protein
MTEVLCGSPYVLQENSDIVHELDCFHPILSYLSLFVNRHMMLYSLCTDSTMNGTQKSHSEAQTV